MCYMFILYLIIYIISSLVSYKISFSRSYRNYEIPIRILTGILNSYMNSFRILLEIFVRILQHILTKLAYIVDGLLPMVIRVCSVFARLHLIAKMDKKGQSWSDGPSKDRILLGIPSKKIILHNDFGFWKDPNKISGGMEWYPMVS